MAEPQNENEKNFMREKIVRPPVNRRRAAGRILCFVLFAAILGAVAAVSFVVSRPMAEKFFGTEPPSSGPPITIERDSDPAAQTTPVETMQETTTEGLNPDDIRDEVERLVGKSMEKFPWTRKNLEELNEAVRNIYLESEKSIVTVSSVKTQVDWFDNPVENRGQYAGIIVAVNPSEAVILTGARAVEEADALGVTFGDGTTASVTVKQRDTVAGMAAIRISTADISEQTLNWLKPVELGNSYSVRIGDGILAVGSPAGRVHSVRQGMISYVAKGVQVPDGPTRVFYTDFSCSSEGGTFLLNLSGQLVGWVTDAFWKEDSEEIPDMAMAMPISEYKGILQKLINGASAPYFGIRGQEVTSPMLQEGIPSGIYITESIAEGPAYRAGIQNGDILTRFEGGEILTMRDFQGRLETMDAGAEATVVVKRKGINEYKEIEYHVTIGAR